MSMTMEQVVTQLQQEVFDFRAKGAEESGVADAVRAVTMTTRFRMETPSFIDGWMKMEAFIARVIKASEMMLEWAAEQSTGIATVLADGYKCGPRSEQNLELVLQKMHAPLRKNPLEAWRRLQTRYDPTTGGRVAERTLLLDGGFRFLEFPAGMERWESYVSRFEKKLKDKFVGLVALVPEELEKLVILDSKLLANIGGCAVDIMRMCY